MNIQYRTEEAMSSYNNMVYDSPSTEVLLTDISSGDHITIETQNSCYEFSVLDPVNGHGLLSGGALGTQAQWAYLVGALDEGRSSNSSVDGACIKTNARALFYLENPFGLKSLILSKVARILHTRSRNGDRLIG
jgi:hypothetical protein